MDFNFIRRVTTGQEKHKLLRRLTRELRAAGNQMVARAECALDVSDRRGMNPWASTWVRILALNLVAGLWLSWSFRIGKGELISSDVELQPCFGLQGGV